MCLVRRNRVWSKEARHLRLLIGSNRDEALIFFRPELLAAYRRGESVTAPIAAREMAQLDVATIRLMGQRYRTAFPAQHDFLRRVQLLSAEEYWIPMLRLAEAHAQRRRKLCTATTRHRPKPHFAVSPFMPRSCRWSG
jgi:hypothetical protein